MQSSRVRAGSAANFLKPSKVVAPALPASTAGYDASGRPATPRKEDEARLALIQL